MNRSLAWLLTYFVTLAVFTVVDATWLILVAADLFKRNVGPILREQPDLQAAVAFYVIYAAGICLLAIRPAGLGSAIAATVNGAALGFIAYATFDLTNLAIIKGWTLGLAIVDMSWGTLATAIAAWLGHAAARRFGAIDAGARSDAA